MDPYRRPSQIAGEPTGDTGSQASAARPVAAAFHARGVLDEPDPDSWTAACAARLGRRRSSLV